MLTWRFVILFCFWSLSTLAQESFDLSSTDESQDTSSYTEVEILHADKLEFNTLEDGSQIRKLVGDVQLKQDSTLMFCDSAYIYKEDNTVKAWGNIHIQEKDSIHAYSNILNYNGKTKTAELIGNARLKDGNKILYSDVLYYNIKQDVGSYLDSGRVEMDSTLLTSLRAYYYTNNKIVHFNEYVVITDPNYHLESDTLHYLTESKVALFFGPTTIYNDSSSIHCVLGSYDTNNEIASFGKGTVINNDPQTLYADSLYYERYRGYGKAFYYFDWVDTEMEAGMEGNSAEYFENNQEIIAYNRPMLKVVQEADTLFLKGDIIHTKENELSGKKEFWSFNNVRIYKEDLQGIGDSLFYSFSDSLMRIYYDPILWNDDNQMMGDTIYLQMANDQIEKIQFVENAFVSMQSKGELFNQIKGKSITGYFEDNEMKTMLSKKNAESLYFGQNDEDEYIGGNYAISDIIKVSIVDKEVDKISFIKEPEAIFTPMRQMNDTDRYLKDFSWVKNLRPKGKGDL
ncbi:MAG: OstA-like protein [Chitinophagales bacterium]